jgi:hypothetical protein
MDGIDFSLLNVFLIDFPHPGAGCVTDGQRRFAIGAKSPF